MPALDQLEKLFDNLNVPDVARTSSGEAEYRLVLSMIDRVYTEIEEIRAKCTQEALSQKTEAGHEIIKARDEVRHTIHEHVLRCWNFLVDVRRQGINIANPGLFMEEMGYLHQSNGEAWAEFEALAKELYCAGSSPNALLAQRVLIDVKPLTIDHCREADLLAIKESPAEKPERRRDGMILD